jgi:hypothetical protein
VATSRTLSLSDSKRAPLIASRLPWHSVSDDSQLCPELLGTERDHVALIAVRDGREVLFRHGGRGDSCHRLTLSLEPRCKVASGLMSGCRNPSSVTRTSSGIS